MTILGSKIGPNRPHGPVYHFHQGPRPPGKKPTVLPCGKKLDPTKEITDNPRLVTCPGCEAAVGVKR